MIMIIEALQKPGIESSVRSIPAPVVSMVDNARATDCRDVSLIEFLNEIKGDKHKESVEEIRAAESKEERSRLKKELPMILFSGRFSKRNAGGLIEHSGILCVDLDDLENPEGWREILAEDSHVLAAFVSPSGNGLKVLVRVDSSKGHAAAFTSGREYLTDNYRLVLDESCKDVSRGCFVSWDPDAFIANLANTEPLKVCDATPEKKEQCDVVNSKSKTSGEPIEKISSALFTITSRPDYANWLRIASSVLSELGEAGIKMLQGWMPEETPGEYERLYKHRLGDVGIGTLYHFAKKLGWSWEKADGENSVAVTDTMSCAETKEFLASKTKFPLPDILSDAIEDEQDWETPPQLIQGLLYQGSKMMIAAPSKAKKSFILEDLALSIGCGKSWMGFDTVQAPVLFLNFEIQDFCSRKRKQAIKEVMRLGPDESKVYHWHLRGAIAQRRGDPELVYREIVILLEKFCKENQIGLVIIDPVYKLTSLSGEENNAGDVGRFLMELEAIAQNTGAAVVFTHHFAKGNASMKDAIDRASGSGVYARDPDAIFTMTAHEAEDCMSVEIKTRNFLDPDPFVVRWDYPTWQKDFDLNPAKLKKPKSANGEGIDPTEILRFLPPEGLMTQEWQAKVEERGICKSSKFYKLMNDLKVQGEVVQRGKRYFRKAEEEGENATF